MTTKQQKRSILSNRLILFFILFTSISNTTLLSKTILKGNIHNSKTKEAIIGATISIKDKSKGTTSNLSGYYELELQPGKYQFIISCISYTSIETDLIEIKQDEEKHLDFNLNEDNYLLNEINVVAKKNREAANILIDERQNSTLAIENLGAREMTIKGLSTAADGIKKITGISMEGKNRVIVRGLGDRYNMTSLNGFPIASPNPDNKLYSQWSIHSL